jgi:hypothetical protein
MRTALIIDAAERNAFSSQWSSRLKSGGTGALEEALNRLADATESALARWCIAREIAVALALPNSDAFEPLAKWFHNLPAQRKDRPIWELLHEVHRIGQSGPKPHPLLWLRFGKIAAGDLSPPALRQLQVVLNRSMPWEKEMAEPGCELIQVIFARTGEADGRPFWDEVYRPALVRLWAQLLDYSPSKASSSFEACVRDPNPFVRSAAAGAVPILLQFDRALAAKVFEILLSADSSRQEGFDRAKLGIALRALLEIDPEATIEAIFDACESRPISRVDPGWPFVEAPTERDTAESWRDSTGIGDEEAWRKSLGPPPDFVDQEVSQLLGSGESSRHGVGIRYVEDGSWRIDRSVSWRWTIPGIVEEVLGDWLQKGRIDIAKRGLRVIRERNRLSGYWLVCLRLLRRFPQALMDSEWALLAEPALLSGPSTFYEAGEAIRDLYALFSEHQRDKIEEAIAGIEERGVGSDGWRAHVRDVILACVGKAGVNGRPKRLDLRRSLEGFRSRGAPPVNEPLLAAGSSSVVVSEPSESELPPDVREFESRFATARPDSKSVRDILPTLKTLDGRAMDLLAQDAHMFRRTVRLATAINAGSLQEDDLAMLRQIILGWVGRRDPGWRQDAVLAIPNLLIHAKRLGLIDRPSVAALRLLLDDESSQVRSLAAANLSYHAIYGDLDRTRDAAINISQSEHDPDVLLALANGFLFRHALGNPEIVYPIVATLLDRADQWTTPKAALRVVEGAAGSTQDYGSPWLLARQLGKILAALVLRLNHQGASERLRVAFDRCTQAESLDSNLSAGALELLDNEDVMGSPDGRSLLVQWALAAPCLHAVAPTLVAYLTRRGREHPEAGVRLLERLLEQKQGAKAASDDHAMADLLKEILGRADELTQGGIRERIACCVDNMLDMAEVRRHVVPLLE